MLGRLVENSRQEVAAGTYEAGGDGSGCGTGLAEAVRARRGRAVIAEVKFASPSRGTITSGDPAGIARRMEAGGAAAISVLTQPRLFGGSPGNLAAVRGAVGIPVLMKDIIVDARQVDAAARLGADCILLIQAVFDRGHAGNMGALLSRARGLGLGVLVEAHDEGEFGRAASSGADIVGINNRDLDTLEVDPGTTCRVLGGGDRDGPVISESGISGPDDVRRLRGCGADGFLVGSAIMGGDVESATRGLAEA
ncbi:Indole-3-glycerol phosphate synthase [Nitrosopumilaceae archaeon]|nr:indole-3-glycerol-phosphate synthase [Nitrosopumilus sp.]CAI9831334.1 Indole-3-glycerol phosphate synthase [Nitrosopumilaceae archaeon]MDA7940926.1 indole-3-glycerol-phosphate synthase [Nitrosopumilus sp.]MDA7943218.1 indole-3-glycerol-phosphate synthase [Nitrosopumilus sp.]MDA7944289.1 indole-3-glycerol-phosphate synthase [Nitrosopumilus sp.]